jgi:PadR family transcriptional regulator, regulatory protein PadR
VAAREATDVLLHFYKTACIVAPVEGQRDRVADHRLDLPQGTLDLLILKALSLQPMHGWAVSERIHQVSRATLQIPQGSLYPALHRLERRGWIEAEWGASDNNRKAKYYELTRAGRKQLEAEADAWSRLTAAVALVLDMG